MEEAGRILQEVKAALQECLRKLHTLNSSFPATEAFLKARGLRSVAELGKDGMRELEDHLLAILYPPKS